jgi:2-phosphosulfolactate phosphatase
MRDARNARRGDAPEVAGRIDIAMTPAGAALMPPADAYVVIDALRATTVMAVLFNRGLRSLRAFADIGAARESARQHGALLFGEEHGLRPEGFDYGNSPAEAAPLELSGLEAVHFTTNGTLALCAVAKCGPTFAGSLVNLSAVVHAVGTYGRVTLVCSGNGRGQHFSLEDFAVAAAFAQRLRRKHPAAIAGDGALLALQLSDSADLVSQSEHAAITRQLGFGADIDYACRIDVAPSVPFVTHFGDGWATLENRLL